jgi:ergothioneine biosynthesis protein EgtB
MELTTNLASAYQQVRQQTLTLVAPLEIEDYVIQTAPFMSPPRWHLGHTSWFFEMLLQQFVPNYQCYQQDFLYYFNSYYEKFGSRIEKAKRGTKSRPTVKQTLQYREYIDQRMTELLANLATLPQATELATLVRLGLEHEMQHQELLVYDIKHLLCDIYPTPRRQELLDAWKQWSQLPLINGMTEFTGGIYQLGYPGQGFAFDNEKPLHKVYLNDYALDRRLVTNGEYLAFIEDKGYQNYQWWYSEAFTRVEQEKWQAPLYWEQEDGRWWLQDFDGWHLVSDRANAPVLHVSLYEAAAFAKWAGKRLPTEAEWERAAGFNEETGEKTLFPWGNSPANPSNANLLESATWQALPAGVLSLGASASGCYQLIGEAWEWTNSDYVPFPGFKSEFDEYTDKWCVSQKVLRGGSYGTPQNHIRASYRNYFYPYERWMLVGFRCAKTL